ncbi:MAG: hypothetical protein FJ184_15580 [Gammaproteobacteria bacterium]|nr:hypothetical protein [Gammaproteobacteria bacterium]
MNKYWITTLLALFGIAMVGPVYAENTQVTVAGVVSSKSDSRSAIQKARPEAIELAKKNAWLVLKKRSEFQQIVFNFGREQDQEMVASLNDTCTPPVDLDQSYDKKLGQLTFRFRFECDLQQLKRDAGRLNGKAAVAGGGYGPGQSRAVLTGMFIAIKDDRVEEFDATIKRSAQDSQSVSTRKQASSSSSSDDRIKEAEKTKASEDVNYGEGDGRISEGVNRSEAMKRRVQKSSSSESASASDSSKTAKSEEQSSGSKVRQSAKVSRLVVSAQELQSALIPLLQRDRFLFVQYGQVASRCGSIPFEQIQDEIRNLPADYPFAVRDSTRDKVLQATSGCQGLPPVRFFVEGYVKIGAPGVDPSTGNVRVSVNVSQIIMDVSNGIEVSRTPEEQIFGTGPDETVATSNALRKAAELVGSTTVSNLASMGI